MLVLGGTLLENSTGLSTRHFSVQHGFLAPAANFQKEVFHKQASQQKKVGAMSCSLLSF